eukprot:2504344-Rhodomonas_salina.1
MCIRDRHSAPFCFQRLISRCSLSFPKTLETHWRCDPLAAPAPAAALAPPPAQQPGVLLTPQRAAHAAAPDADAGSRQPRAQRTPRRIQRDRHARTARVLAQRARRVGRP